MTSRVKAHIALGTTHSIYGINYIIAKGLMPDRIAPSALVILRILGAGLLFLILKLFVKESIDKKDWPLLILTAILGVTMNQLCSMNGLGKTSPVDASIIMTGMPVFTLIASYFILKELLTPQKIIGLLIAASGALFLIYISKSGNGSSSLIGNLIVFGAAFSFGMYLVLVKPLMEKYKPITVVVWSFLIGLIGVIPFGASDLIHTNFSDFSDFNWFSLFYVIIGPTFIAYLLNMYSLQHVRSSVTGIYAYIQPVVAMLLVFFIGILFPDSILKGDLTLPKILCCILIFTGVFLVSTSKRRSD